MGIVEFKNDIHPLNIETQLFIVDGSDNMPIHNINPIRSFMIPQAFIRKTKQV